MTPSSPIAKKLQALNLHRESSLATARACEEASYACTRHERVWFRKMAKRIEACAVTFHARVVTPPGEPTRLELSHRRDCKAPICQLSARSRSRKLRKKILAIIDRVQAAHPKVTFVLLTVTTVNRPWAELPAMLDDQARGIDRFFKLPEVKRAFTGAIIASEIACRGTDSAPEAGAHAHILLACHDDYFIREGADIRYLSQQRITVLFQRALRVDYRPIVWIERVKARDGSTGPASVRKAVAELAKYVCKGADLVKKTSAGLEADPHVIRVLARTLHRRRMLRLTGVFAAASRIHNKHQQEASSSN